MTTKLRPGEYWTKCKCSRMFRVYTYDKGIDREQCFTCQIHFKSVYLAMGNLTPAEIEELSKSERYQKLLDPTIKREAH